MDWQVRIGDEKYQARDAAMILEWLDERRVHPETPVFHPGQQRWICLRDVPELSSRFSAATTLIEKYREDYSRALFKIDHEAAELVRSGAEMRGLILLTESFAEIISIHESLHQYYGLILNRIDVLKKFGSDRLRQLGHDPVWTRKALEETGQDAEILEAYVLQNLRKHGYERRHWLIKDVLLCELEYMLDALQILVEPEFVPLQTSETVESEAPDRYIPPQVKIAVWRRDEGKCVECKSREKLEYDHVIPVAKGGSNTERNIQLLCEKCNRQKAARIQ